MNADIRAAVEAIIETVTHKYDDITAAHEQAGPARAEAARRNAELLRRTLSELGINPQPLDALAAEHAGSVRSRAQEASRRATAASAAITERLARHRPPVPVAPILVIDEIDEVMFIRSFAGAGTVLDSAVEPLNNWARYRFKGSSDHAKGGVGRLSVFALWQNSESDTVTISALVCLIVNAHLSLEADAMGVAAWSTASAQAAATVRARTTIHAVWNANVSAIVHDEIVASSSLSGGFFGDDDSVPIEVNKWLDATGFVVPAGAYILIETELLTEWKASNGSITLDAESGSQQVVIPKILITPA